MEIARIIARTVAFVHNLFHRTRVDDALDEELRAYVAGVVAEKVRDGIPPRDAERAARLELGGYDVVKEKVRDIRTGALLDGVLRDCRFAARTLRKTPVFTVVAVIALALGIGATTAMLSVVRSVLVEPLSYADADHLAVILHDGRNPASPRNFNDWRAQTRSFSDMAAAEYWSPDLTSGDNPTQVPALRITSGMLPMLGVAPLLGRVFSPAEEQPGNDHVVVLGYGLWQRMFAGRRDVLGATMSLDGSIYTVIGVMPKSFTFAPFWRTDAEVWGPLALANRLNDGQSLRIFARLAPGVTLERARADLGAVTAALEARDPGSNRNVVLTPLKEKVVGDLRTPLLTLLVAVTFVLLTACANVAHMLLARAAARQRELSLRTALGATRARLFAQMLVESILLAVLGGGAGFALAAVGIHALVAASPAIIPRVASVTLDGGVLAIAVIISAATVIVFGLLPALRAARVDPVETFRDGDRASSDGRGRARVRNALVASEFALALVLLIGAGLMIRTLIALQRIDPGFDPRNVVSMIVSTAGTPAADTGRHAAFYVNSLTRVRALPGVESASYINHRPFDGDMWGFAFRLEGAPHPRPGDWPTATFRVVFPRYFETMRIPILRGRDVAETDRLDTPGVVVINEFMAKTHWPGLDPIGRRITLDDSTWLTVVGIVKDNVRESLSAPHEEEMFFAFAQRPRYLKGLGASRTMTLVARVACPRTECDASTFVAPIRDAIRSVERNAPISAVATFRALARTATAESRFYLLLLAAFAAIAVVLAAVGIYGVMAYAVSRRTHEIGIRIALGAEPGSVMRAVVGEGVSMASIGAAAGLATALGLTRLMRGILYGVSPFDVWTFAAVTALLVAVALVATLVPARRATRVDPLIALRSD
jgi:putative ABC transport system permease protein